MSLRPCPECRRHARGDQCPFCHASIEPARKATGARVSRAVVFATVTATAAIVTDCGESAPVPFYGGCPACVPDASDAAAASDSSDASDASAAADALDASDAHD